MNKIVNTPPCPICLKNYSSTVIPKLIYPCGHGICSACLTDFQRYEEEENGNVDEIRCPQCREIIVQSFENYDLQHITNNVNLNSMPYWSKRLLEAVDTRGAVIEIDDKLMPFCRTLFTRIVYSEDLKTLAHIKTDNWTECDRQKVQSIIRAFLGALINSDTQVNEALDWISVLNMPQRVEVKLLQDVNKFYTCKDFLKRMNAEWLMDTLFE